MNHKLTNSSKKIFTLLLFIFSFFSLFNLFTTPTKAVSGSDIICFPDTVLDALRGLPIVGPLIPGATDPLPWYNQGFCQFKEKVFDPANPEEIFGERYTYAQVNWITNSVILQAVDAFSKLVTGTLLSQAPNTSNIANNSFAPGNLSLMGQMDTINNYKPALLSTEISRNLEKFSIATPVSAQGYGFESLEPVRVLWAASRNSSYLMMVVLLIVAGFMIMFRVKINPQTAVSVQIMIPKIITTLVLVTFSYAISGFIIEFVYILLRFIISIMPNSLFTNKDVAISVFSGGDFFKVIGFYMGGLNFGFLFFVPLLALVIFVIAFIIILKVWWMMLKTYISLIVKIIIGPWQIMLGILPNSPFGGFGGWLKGLISDASVFVIVPLMFMFNMIIWLSYNPLAATLGSQTVRDAVSILPVGPFTNLYNQLVGTDVGLAANTANVNGGQATLPVLPLVGTAGILFNIAFGYAVLAMIPKIATIIQDSLKTGGLNKYGAAFGEPLGDISNLQKKYSDNRAKTEANAFERAKAQVDYDKARDFYTSKSSTVPPEVNAAYKKRGAV